MKLSSYSTAQLGGGIHLVDIGASGPGDPRWTPLAHLVHLVGFEPNQSECARLNGEPGPFASATFLPYAIADVAGDHTLYCTRNKFCYSLLEPDHSWLDRFSYRDLFTVTGTETVSARPLSDVTELAALDIDAVKVDAQGIELKILQSSGAILDQAFYVETESGFVSNYVGESTQAEVDLFMRDRGFLMFDINPDHRITRANEFAKGIETRAQPLWCEVVWLKDYVRLGTEGLTEAKALKALLLCAGHGFLDYGLELAALFHRDGLLSEEQFTALASPEAWAFPTPAAEVPPRAPLGARLVSNLLCLLPWRFRQEVKAEFNRVADGPNWLKRL